MQSALLCAGTAKMVERLWQTSEGKAVVFLSAFLAAGLPLLLLLLQSRRNRHRGGCLNLPSRPFRSLPIVGDLLHLPKIRNPARHRFGPIFTLRVGKWTLIVVTSPSLAHAALVEDGRLFADRPLMPTRKLFTSNFRNINSAPYGDYWRSMRRNLVQEMLAMPKILAFKSARQHAIAIMISKIRTESERNQGVVPVYPIIRFGMFELLLFMCFGYHMKEEEIFEISELLDAILKLTAMQLFDFLPLAKLLRRNREVSERELRTKQVDLFSSHFQKHKELKEMGQLTRGSYLETLLRMDLSTHDVVTLCSEFMAGGTDTTVTTLEWAMAHLVRNPSIQSKLYCHIRDVVGDRPVEEVDLEHLPYLQAVVKETLRFNPPGHTLLPHAVSAHTKLGGYDIPPDAFIVFDVISTARDPKVWKDPLIFQPERFIQSEIDITGTKEVTMIPFGAGRRICPGLGLGSMHMEMFIAHFVQAFEWSSWPVGTEVDLTESQQFTVRMKQSLKATVKRRKS